MTNITVIESTENEQWVKKSFQENYSGKTNLLLTSERKRTFYGYGSCANELGIRSLMNLPKKQQDQIYDDLFLPNGEVKFTYCRLPIGANDYSEFWYSYNEVDEDYDMTHFSIERDQKYIIPYIKEALKRNPSLEFCASPWSPPTWMKTRKTYNSGYIRDEPKIYEAYALYFVKYVQAYAAEGIKIHQIHVQNEWVSNHVFPSCKWTGDQLRIFIKDYLGPAFEKYQIDSEIWLATCNAPHPRIEWKEKRTEDFDVNAGLVLEDEGAYQYIKGCGYQWAGRDAIQKNVEAYPELDYLQTECECGDGQNTWFYAQYLFNNFRHYIINGVNGFLYWNAILETGGESTWGTYQNSMVTIDSNKQTATYTKEYYLMKHFSHYVEKGARRIKTEGPHTASTVAFENPDGSKVVVIANRKEGVRDLNMTIGTQLIQVELAAHSFTTIIVE